MAGKKPFIKNFTVDKLADYLEKTGQPRFRAEQIYNEIYIKRASSFEEMDLLPKSLRNELSDDFQVNSIKINKVSRSKDGSMKFLFDLYDGYSVEAVYMPWMDKESDEADRVTLCISSMSGCPVECAFCATGTLGKGRNLETAEIVDQLLLCEEELGTKITNVVFMGMGEPLLNYNNVLRSIDIMTEPSNKLLTKKKITLSTVGISSKIKHLADAGYHVKLALSLHATTNGFRQKIVPKLMDVDLQKLLSSVEYYYRATRIPVTYEYILFDGMNDSTNDAKRLAKITKRVPSRANIIPFNDISFTNPTGFAATLKPAPAKRMNGFIAEVVKFGGRVTVRDTFGEDIEAACGQLALSDN